MSNMEVPMFIRIQQSYIQSYPICTLNKKACQSYIAQHLYTIFYYVQARLST